MMAREIGSEFWLAEKGTKYRVPEKTYLSGRTALTAIILDLKIRGVRNVGLPDYLCESMIEPFLRHNIKPAFYPVQRTLDGLTISLDALQSFEAVMLVNYFGLMRDQINSLAISCQRLGKIVILDLTHDVFSSVSDYSADYIFGSYRKWTGIEFGFAFGNRSAHLMSWPLSNYGLQYLALREEARNVKQLFVNGGYVDDELRHKQLDLFESAEDLLDREYISDTDERNKSRLASLNVDYIKKRRRDNASAIYSQFQHMKICAPMFEEIPYEAIPLAVPIFVPHEKRDSLRAHLRKNGIFCPVHWPLSVFHKTADEAVRIYTSEISLVCDQRYDTEDMARTMEMIKQWENTTSK